VSDLLTSPSDDEEDPEDSRRRALKGLTVLAAVAAVVVGLVLLIVAVSGTGHPGKRLADNNITEQPTEPATPTPTTSPTATPSSPSTSPSTSAHATPTSTANPCPSATPCAVTGDDGGVVDAVNKFRVSHGRPAVPGSVSANAQQCALKQGNGPTCVPHYAWEAVPTQDGQMVITMIAGRSSGLQWLLDPGISSFSVGWAYAPGSGYECAILKAP
jgi:hypothetical protein